MGTALTRGPLFLVVFALLPACSASSSAPACASGVLADGKCLLASDGGPSGSGGAAGSAPFGTEVGAPCLQPRALVCGHAPGDGTSDRVLLCQSGTFAEKLACATPSVCADLVGHTSVHCGPPDDAVPYAIEGDPCAPEQAAACPFDRASLLVCTGEVWARAQSCAVGLTCHRTSAGTQGAGWSCPASSASGCVVCE